MTTTFRESCTVFNTAAFHGAIKEIAAPFEKRFWRNNHFYVLFHTFFLSLIGTELIGFTLKFVSLLHSTALAIFLAGIFLTIFTYLVLFFYFQARGPEKLMQLRDDYLIAVKIAIPYSEVTLEYHRAITQAIFSFINALEIQSVGSRWVRHSETLSFLVEKFRIWTQWKDLLRMKEMLLISSIREHIRLIKREPSDLEAHASLASNYQALSELYQDPKKLAHNEDLTWTPPEFISDKMHEKFVQALERALEEYHIIDGYAPNDPWVHAQCAAIYRELNRFDDEMSEYEIILEIDPENDEVMMRLGGLYFRLGQTAKGLKIYDQLRRRDHKKGLELIAQYDDYTIEEYSFEE
jgi:tetratricopeptide (TPR) repeat protein